MSASQEPARSGSPDEQDDEDDVPVQPLSPRERAAKAAAAAQARAEGHKQQDEAQPEVSTAPVIQPSQEQTASVASSIQASTGVQVDPATAALAAATLSTNPDVKADLARSLAEQLECSICRETVYQPVSVLDCLHTFCGSCLARWVAAHPGEPECPTCRSPARATKDSHQHNSLRDVLIRMDPSQDRSEEEKAEMRRIYTPGSAIDLVSGRAATRNQAVTATGRLQADMPGYGTTNTVAQQQLNQGLMTNAFGTTSPFTPRPTLTPFGIAMRPTVMINPVDELNLLLRYYFPCPTCEPNNPFRYRCAAPIPDPRMILVTGHSAGGDTPIPRRSVEGGQTPVEEQFPIAHCMCFNCKRPNLMPKRDRRQYPQDVCAVCSERFCQNVLGYCGPIKQRHAREFKRLDEYEMPPRQGLLASAFGLKDLFGAGSDPDSIGSFMPQLFGEDRERIRSFDHWLKYRKNMSLNDFYHAVIQYAIDNSPPAVVVGGDEPGLKRARWQGVPGRAMRNQIRKDDWTCIVCAKDIVEGYAAEWYNEQLRRDPPPPPPKPAPSAEQEKEKAKLQLQKEKEKQASSSGGFFSSLKKGFNDLENKFTEMTTDQPYVPPDPPTPLIPPPPAANFTDRQLLRGNQSPRYPPHLASSRDLNGHPVFLTLYHQTGSTAIIPGKACPNLKNPVRVALDGKEYILTENDKYETFLENEEVHKWVRCTNGVLPQGEIPVPAGLERDGRTPLHIACAWHEGLRIPGYSGPNTQGARIGWGGQEINVRDDYEILVWRDFSGSEAQNAAARSTRQEVRVY